MSFRERVVGGPRNIRKNRFCDRIVIILVTCCSVSALSLYRGLSITEHISSKPIHDAVQFIKQRVQTLIFSTKTKLSPCSPLSRNDEGQMICKITVLIPFL